MKTLVLLLVLSFSILGQTYRYVDPEATGANNGLSWENAWNGFDDFDINDHNKVPPGTTILIGPGTYTQRHSNYVIPNPPEPDRYALVLINNNNNITLLPCSPGSMPWENEEMNGEVIFESTAYEYGIMLWVQENTAVDYISINKISFNKFLRNAIFMTGFSDDTTDYVNEVLIKNCTISPLKDGINVVCTTSCAAIHTQRSKNIKIENCRIDYGGNRTAQTDGLYFDRSKNMQIRDNYIFVENNATPPAVPLCKDNYYHNDCIQFADQSYGKCTDIIIERNQLIQNGNDHRHQGIAMTGIEGAVEIYNNNIVGKVSQNLLNIYVYSYTSSLYIFNNTLIGKENNLKLAGIHNVSGDLGQILKIRNNIFYKEGGNNPVGLTFFLPKGISFSNNILDYNLYHNPSTTMKIEISIDSNSTSYNWDEWDENGIGENPEFTNPSPTNYLYTLQYSSPAKNKGLKIDAIPTDILSHSRPYWQENAYDIGSYEIPDAQFKIGVTGVLPGQEVYHTITPIGKNWERAPAGNWQMTNSTASSTHPTTDNSDLDKLNTWEGWNFDWLHQGTTDPNQKFRLGFYKLSIHIPPPISLDDYIYLDFRDGAYSIDYEPEIHIYYDKEQHTYKINQNGVWINKISGDVVRVWDLKGQTSNTNLLPYYWANALIPLISKDDHPLVVWGPNPNNQGTYIVWRKYKDYNFEPLPSTQLLQYEDLSVIVQQGEDPESFLVKYKVANSLSQETNIVEYTVISIFEKMLSDIGDLVFQLHQNYPNPFNPQTTISFTVPEDSKVSLAVYDILGKEVVTLVNDNLNAGMYDVEFNARNLASGIYFYRLSAGKNYETKKLQLIK